MFGGPIPTGFIPAGSTASGKGVLVVEITLRMQNRIKNQL
jgi:hypothetical protein